MSRREYEQDDYEAQYDKDDFSEISMKRSRSERKTMKGKKHGSPHRGSVAGIFDLAQEQSAEEAEGGSYGGGYVPSHPDVPRTAPLSAGPVSSTPFHGTHVYGPHTMEFRTVKVDFDGVISISTLAEDYMGKPSYGLKFSFAGKNGASKTVWYRYKDDRDADCTKAAAYFKSLKGLK